jgi:RNA polymerase sigma-70 factor (ECF subfamily)
MVGSKLLMSTEMSQGVRFEGSTGTMERRREEMLETIDGRIAAARRGDREEVGRAIESCRTYLLLVAERRLPADLKVKDGASDLVQETLLEAQRCFGRFEGRTVTDLRAWLRRLLLNKVSHAARRYLGTAKRRLGRELSLDAELDRDGVANALAIDQTSPGTVAARREQEATMVAALDRLPERMRRAVLWRHHEGCSFDEIGRRLGCSNVAARKVWLRALQQLQREFAEDGD